MRFGRAFVLMKDKTPANFLIVLKDRTIVNFLVEGLAAVGGFGGFWSCGSPGVLVVARGPDEAAGHPLHVLCTLRHLSPGSSVGQSSRRFLDGLGSLGFSGGGCARVSLLPFVPVARLTLCGLARLTPLLKYHNTRNTPHGLSCTL